jgi:hypothetical protein
VLNRRGRIYRGMLGKNKGVFGYKCRGLPVVARFMRGMNAGMTRSPCRCHSAAIACASAAVGSSKVEPQGVTMLRHQVINAACDLRRIAEHLLSSSITAQRSVDGRRVADAVL